MREIRAASRFGGVGLRHRAPVVVVVGHEGRVVAEAAVAAPLVRERALAAAVDLKTPEVARAEPGAVCPVCQHGRMPVINTVYRPPAVWDLSVPAPGLDTS